MYCRMAWEFQNEIVTDTYFMLQVACADKLHRNRFEVVPNSRRVRLRRSYMVYIL